MFNFLIYFLILIFFIFNAILNNNNINISWFFISLNILLLFCLLHNVLTNPVTGSSRDLYSLCKFTRLRYLWSFYAICRERNRAGISLFLLVPIFSTGGFKRCTNLYFTNMPLQTRHVQTRLQTAEQLHWRFFYMGRGTARRCRRIITYIVWCFYNKTKRILLGWRRSMKRGPFGWSVVLCAVSREVSCDVRWVVLWGEVADSKIAYPVLPAASLCCI